MYTNIKTGLSLHHIGKFALENKEHLTVPPAVLMDALHLLMTNKVFQFGDTFWLQKVGTAMGAPPAPPWATIFFGIHEETVLRKIWTQTPTISSLHRQRSRDLAGQSRPSRRQHTMDVISCFNAILLRARVDLWGKIKRWIIWTWRYWSVRIG